MHFDDRLETVLRLPDSGDGLARIQFRQLIDILGRLQDDPRSSAVEAGFARLEVLSARIPAADRARLLRHPLQPLVNPRLLAVLAEAEPDVASTAIGNARLADPQWLALIPRLPVRARGILRHRRDLSPAVEALLEQLGVRDRALPPADLPPVELHRAELPPVAPAPRSVDEPLATPGEEDYVSPDVLDLLDLAETSPLPVPNPHSGPASGESTPPPPEPTSLNEWAQARAARERAAAQAEDGIGAIVRRIEEFRRVRQTQPEPGSDAPRLPLGDPSPARRALAIDFATDAEGRVAWADGPWAPAIVGLALAAHAHAEADGGAAVLPAAMRRRLPLRGLPLEIEGAPAVRGEWQVDAVPRFDPAGGRFTGYCGRMRRPSAAAAQGSALPSEAERMREILHELRTPANAIQVAAEIIQQQLYGPAPHEYRALAASIAGDCAHILAGFEELDRLVKLETGVLPIEPGECDLAQVLAQTIARLRAWTEPRRSGFVVDPAPAPSALPAWIDRGEAERLVWRLFAALAGATAPDEALPLSWSHAHGRVAVRARLPAALAAREGDELFGTTPPSERGQSLSAGMFGVGFTLRLAAAEAAAAGGGLRREEDMLCLWLPAAGGAATECAASDLASPGLTPADAGNSNSVNCLR